MAMSNAERQAKYRLRRKLAGDACIRSWVPGEVGDTLVDLSQKHRVTQKDMLERAIDMAHLASEALGGRRSNS